MDQDEGDLDGESYGSVKLEPVEDYLEDRPDLIFIQSLDNFIDRSHPTATSAATASQANPQPTPSAAAVQRPQIPCNSSASVPAKPTKPSHCCVVGCKNSSPNSAVDPVQMFDIPTDINLRLKWLKNLWIGQPKFIPTDSCKVCYLHFKKTAFTEATRNLSADRELKLGSLPTVFPWSKPPARRKRYTPWSMVNKKLQSTAEVPLDHNTAGGSSVNVHRSLKVIPTVKREVIYEATDYQIAGGNSVRPHRSVQIIPTVKREPAPEASPGGSIKFKAVPTTTKSAPAPKLPAKCAAIHDILASVDAATASSGDTVHVTSTAKRKAAAPEVSVNGKSTKFSEYMFKLSTCTVAIKECLLDLEDISTILGNKDYLPKHLADELEGCTNYIEDSTTELENIAKALSKCMSKSGVVPIREEHPNLEEDSKQDDSVQEDPIDEDDSIREENQIEEETVKVKTEIVDEEQEEIQQEELHIKEEEISDDEELVLQHDEIDIKEEQDEMESVVTPKKRSKVIGFSFKNGRSFDLAHEADVDNADDVEPVVMKQLHRQNLLGTDKPVVIDDDKINVLLEHSYAMSWVGGFDGQPEGGWIKCEMCMYRCRNQERMNTHFEENHVSKQCSQCSFTANSLVLIRKHFAREHPFQGGDWMKCPHCTFSAAKQSEMRLHIRSNHTDARGWVGRGTGRTPKRAKIEQVEESVQAGSSTSLASK